MRKRQKEAILVSFFKEKEKYEKLAEFILHLIRDDPSSPKESLHTIIYRIKDNARLIDKIDEENKHAKADAAPITHKNFQNMVGDLLGIRLICLRLSDIKRVEAYLELLAEEKILRYIRKPEHKRSFVLPVEPGESIPEDLDPRYSGYSSIHYQVKLGENSDAPDELKGLQVEFQLRTILEEAWGEIDHTGFYILSTYLQAAALQAEHLCRQAEAHRFSIIPKTKRKSVAPVIAESGAIVIPVDGSALARTPTALQVLLEETFDFNLTARTLTYIVKRLNELEGPEHPKVLFMKIFTKNRLLEFKTILREVLDREAFKDNRQRDVDAINAVNFALSFEIHGRRVAQEGLRSVLKWRKKRSIW
jgi:ppGpp synthetase/RelA/SpoT-type nucleotidyltranferase